MYDCEFKLNDGDWQYIKTKSKSGFELNIQKLYEWPNVKSKRNYFIFKDFLFNDLNNKVRQERKKNFQNNFKNWTNEFIHIILHDTIGTLWNFIDSLWLGIKNVYYWKNSNYITISYFKNFSKFAKIEDILSEFENQIFNLYYKINNQNGPDSLFDFSNNSFWRRYDFLKFLWYFEDC